MTSAWTAAHVAGIAAAALPATPSLVAGDIVRVVPGRDLWDFWPLQTLGGAVASIAGGELWFALSAAREGAPDRRHDCARLRLLRRDGGDWCDLGAALPDGFSPGSREWSGSAVVDADCNRLTLFFTAAGRRGEGRTTYEQRLFQTCATLAPDGRPSNWTTPTESVASDGLDYVVVDQAEGAIGTIKAFRDPGYFHDPANGTSYLLFAASLARSRSAFNGAVGIARADGSGQRWSLLPPVVHADSLNNELERPHVVFRDRRYYLFWSTQSSVFASGIEAPTGLYGMVADHLLGRYEPLNGTGLVLANPAVAPAQAYSWLVLDDLRVTSFIDQIGSGRAGFGGSPAPELRLSVDGARAWLAA